MCHCNLPSPIRTLWLVLVAGAAEWANSGSAFAADQPVWKPCPDNAAKVVLLHAGALTLNGRQVAPASLITAIAALRPVPTVVCYTQERPDDQPDPGTSQVVEGLMFVGLGLSVYTDATFTQLLFSAPPRDFRRKRAAGGSEPGAAP
jgi:hypothetical protein